MSNSTSFISPKLDVARMRPITNESLIQLIADMACVENENLELLYLDKGMESAFVSDIKDKILSELGIIERCYRLGNNCGEDWYDEDRGVFISVTEREEFVDFFPDTLVSHYDVSLKYAKFVAGLLKLFIKNKALELATLYNIEFDPGVGIDPAIEEDSVDSENSDE